MAPVTTNIYPYNYDFRISLEYREIVLLLLLGYLNTIYLLFYRMYGCTGSKTNISQE